MEYVVGSVAALVSGNVTPSRPKHLKRALTPTKHQPSPNVTPKSELVDRSIFLSPTLQKKKEIAKKSPKRIFENQNLDVTEEDSNLVSPKADKVKKHLEIELDGNTSVNSSLLSPESPKDSSEMKKSPKKLKVMNAAAHVYENTSPKNNKRKLNEEPVNKNVESNDASPNKKKKQERKPLSQDAANANQQNGAQSPKKNKKEQQQEAAKPNQGKNIKPQNQVQNSQAKQKPGQQNKNKAAEKSVKVQSPKKQNQVQNLQGKQKQKPAQQNNKNKPAQSAELQRPKKQNQVQTLQGKQKQKPTQQNNKNKPAQSAELQSPKKQNQVQETHAKQNQKAGQQNNKNKLAEESVEAQNPKKQNKKKNRTNKKNQNQLVPKPEPKVEEAESEESDEDDDDEENDDSINPNISSYIGSDSDDEVESGSDEDDDDEEDDDDDENDNSINPNTSSNIGSDSDDEVESGSDEDDDDEEDDDEDDEENDDTVNPNAIANEDSDSEHDSDDEIESENDEANKQALQPEESSDDEEEEEVKDTKKNAKKPEKKGKGPKVELTEEQKTEALEEEIKRTVFVGNVPFSKKCKKEIKKIFNEYGTIETIRIRTVPVKDATVTPKLAVIKNELHPERSTVNVYVKFADEASVEKALKANNTVLNSNHLRVHRTGTTGAVHDPKLSVFVGNIPFALEDEGLRAKFEKCGAIESVRIIRDRKTHAGKGFGYVNFESKDGVELALAMSEEDLTIKNRILRVKRCTHTEKKNKDKLPKKFVGNFQSNNKVQGDDGKKNNGAYRRIEMKRKLEARVDGPANKRANVNQPRDKKQRKEFVGMTAEKNKKRKFDKGQKKKKVLGEILAKK